MQLYSKLFEQFYTPNNKVTQHFVTYAPIYSEKDNEFWLIYTLLVTQRIH